MEDRIWKWIARVNSAAGIIKTLVVLAAASGGGVAVVLALL
jgi:hypothetical protein